MPRIEVDTDDLMTSSMIADELGVTRPAVSNWGVRRASTGFPEPVLAVGTTLLYSRTQVRAWAQGRTTTRIEALRARRDRAEADYQAALAETNPTTPQKEN